MHPRIKVPAAYKKGNKVPVRNKKVILTSFYLEFPGAADFYENFVEPKLPVIFENGNITILN